MERTDRHVCAVWKPDRGWLCGRWVARCLACGFASSFRDRSDALFAGALHEELVGRGIRVTVDA